MSAEDPASQQRTSTSQTSKSFTIVPLSELVRRRDAGDVVPHFTESGVSSLCASSISCSVLGLCSSEADGFFDKKAIAVYDFQGQCLIVCLIDLSGRDFFSVNRSDLIKTCERLASGSVKGLKLDGVLCSS